MKKTICTLAAIAMLNAATPERAEGQTPAQLRAQIQQKYVEIDNMERQFNTKAEAAARFHAANIGTINRALPEIERQQFSRANQQRVLNEATALMRQEFTPRELQNPSLAWEAGNRVVYHKTKIHVDNIWDALDKRYPAKFVDGDIRIGRHDRHAIEPNIDNTFERISSATLRVHDRAAREQRNQLRARIDDTRRAKNVLYEQLRVENMTPAQRAAHNRQMGW